MFTQITMLHNRGQQYVPWKGTSTNSAVPSWSRPLQKTEKETNGVAFRARPIKHWRKQLIPTPFSGSGISAIGMPFNRPGSEVFLGRDSSSNCATCSDSNAVITKSSNEAEQNNTIFEYISDKFFDEKDEKAICVACNPEANVIKPSSTLLDKKYYSDRTSYLKSRCKTYKQNLSGTQIKGNQYLNGTTPIMPSDSPTSGSQIFSTNDCCKFSGMPSTLIYKPNNSQYDRQGAVDSSDRIVRLKMNTINKK
jgi:hypothetical protein